jgi:hypothetical protein
MGVPLKAGGATEMSSVFPVAGSGTIWNFLGILAAITVVLATVDQGGLPITNWPQRVPRSLQRWLSEGQDFGYRQPFLFPSSRER